MKTVISASRRTDMPARYLDHLIACIRQGCVEVPNPFSRRTAVVDLRPEAVHTIVLWSKNFGPFLENGTPFRPYHLYFLFTINDLASLEPDVPSLATRLDQARELALRYGPECIGWRYDPVIFRGDRPVSDAGDFERIGSVLAASGIRRAIFSFLDLYGKVSARSRAFNLGFTDPPNVVKIEFALKLARIAASLGMSLESCCESLVDVPGVNPSACINGALLARLTGEDAPRGKDSGQRKSCNCTVSRDIGSYRDMPCGNGCLYCYANPVIPDRLPGV